MAIMLGVIIVTCQFCEVSFLWDTSYIAFLKLQYLRSSPDLNPLHYLIWFIVEKTNYRENIINVERLKNLVVLEK